MEKRKHPEEELLDYFDKSVRVLTEEQVLNSYKELKKVKPTPKIRKDTNHDLNQYFSNKKRPITMGMEVEMYLYDNKNKQLLNDGLLLDLILNSLPQKVTKDHYSYQLEIRTGVHTDPEELFKDFVETLNLCNETFNKFNISIYPASFFQKGAMFNGVHFHLRSLTKRLSFENSLNNIYPFILTLTDIFKNSKYQDCYSFRFSESPHLSIPNLNRLSSSRRNSDVCVNRHRENTRHRMKKDFTIEARTFDVPFNADYLKNLIDLIFNTYSYMKVNKKIRKSELTTECLKAISNTRYSIMDDKMGINYCFAKTRENYYIYKFLCDRFKLPIVVKDKAFSIGNENTVEKFLGKYFKEIKKDEIKPMLRQ